MDRTASRRRKTNHARQTEPVTPAYPPAPWQLGGWGFATVGLLDATVAAASLPAGASVVRVVNQKTVGGLLFASYERGSLVYRELCVVAALVRVGKRFAFWIPRLYVDADASLAGGREIWGLPKERAEFDVRHDIGVTTVGVRQGATDVCRIRCTVPPRSIRVPTNVPMPAFGTREGQFLFFSGKLDTRVATARADVMMAADGGYAGHGLERPRFAVRLDGFSLVVPAPNASP